MSEQDYDNVYSKCNEYWVKGCNPPDYLYAQLKKAYITLENKKDPKIYWITINPKNEISFADFEAKMRKFLTRKWIKEYYATFEQRSEDYKNPFGFHCHALLVVSESKRKSEILRETFNSFKDMVGNKLHCDVRNYPYSFFADKMAYLRGEKDDEAKDRKVEADRLWRNEIGIPDIISSK